MHRAFWRNWRLAPFLFETAPEWGRADAEDLGGAAPMQGLADAYFVIPYTLGEYFATHKLDVVSADQEECEAVMRAVDERTEKLLGVDSFLSVDSLHRALGLLTLDVCGTGTLL